MSTPLEKHSAALTQLNNLRNQEIGLQANLTTAMSSAMEVCDSLTAQPGWAAANIQTPAQMLSTLDNLEAQVAQQLTALEAQYASLVNQLNVSTSSHGPDPEEEA